MVRGVCVRLFLLVPLLLYTGTRILTRRVHANTLGFHATVVVVVALALFFQVGYMLSVVGRIARNQEYQDEFGVFLLALAVFVAIFGARELSNQPQPSRCRA